jgi:Fungal Zn(2)-Cys(6) binuclear cluster domain
VRLYKSRRKSCIPCATAKCKCDLQQPCACCKSRNKECIFPTDSSPDTSPIPPGKHDWDISDSLVTNAFDQVTHTQVSGQKLENSFDQSEPVSFVSTLMPVSHSEHASVELISLIHNDDISPPFPLCAPSDLKSVYEFCRNSHTIYPHSFSTAPTSTIFLPLKAPFPPLARIESLDNAPESQLRNYMFPFSPGSLDTELCCMCHLSSIKYTIRLTIVTVSLCLHRFSVNIPIIHTPSWTADNKPPVLTTVMQACGATFIDSLEARTFVRFVTDAVPDMLTVELVSFVIHAYFRHI